MKRGLRILYVKYQDLAHRKRTSVEVKKGSQWCSVTQDFVEYLLGREESVRELFSGTFCPDEMFVQTVCFNSPFCQKVKAAATEFEGNMRFIKWEEGKLLPIVDADFDAMVESDRWFARKFSESGEELINRTVQISR